ncbi:hypothetical protein [Mucilaginibacter sp.]
MNHLFKSAKDTKDVSHSSTATLLTAQMFFGRNGETPYEVPEKFLSFGESLRPKEANDWQKLVLCLKNNMKMDGNPATGVDAGNRPYTFHRVYKSRATLGFKMINGGGMPQLIEDYQEGKILIGFTLDDLIEEAKKV